MLSYQIVVGLTRSTQEIGSFSYDDSHTYRPDESSLRYYYPPRLGANLSRGFEHFRKLDDTADDHLDALLKTVSRVEKETASRVTADFITWRGMMTKVGLPSKKPKPPIANHK